MEHSILNESIEKLNFSAELKQTCRKNNFGTLKPITEKDIDALLKKDGFTMHQILEIVEILEQKGFRNEKWNT